MCRPSRRKRIRVLPHDRTAGCTRNLQQEEEVGMEDSRKISPSKPSRGVKVVSHRRMKTGLQQLDKALQKDVKEKKAKRETRQY